MCALVGFGGVQSPFRHNNSLDVLSILTICYAVNCGFQITISLLKREDNIFIRPLWEHFLDCADLAAIFLLKLADFAIIFN